MTTGPCGGAPRGRFLVLDCGRTPYFYHAITTVFGALRAPPCAWIGAPRRFCLARQLQGAGGHPGANGGHLPQRAPRWRRVARQSGQENSVVEFLLPVTGAQGWL